MHKNPSGALRPVALACTLLASTASQAFTFETESVKGSFDSTISVGTGIRTKDPSCSLVTEGATPIGAAPAGCLAASSMLGDQGNLNYGKGDAFTTYLKGNHELLLKMPSDVTAMGRVNWVRDFSATRTTGFISATTPFPTTDGLSDSARDDLEFKARLLDLWVSKGFQIGEQQARIRVGNQVISWGESLFLPGGINSTNAMDIMRLSQPGTQLKEVFLAAPMVSLASGVAPGVNVEAYVQTNWNKSYFPPSGSYWSVVNGLGKGADAYNLFDKDARNSGQWGAAVKYAPQGTQLNLGAYFLKYHDKTPNFKINFDDGTAGWAYAENRELFGLSANFPLGDWAIGTELSYRPKDAVALNALSGCASQNGNCWVDEKRFQWHLTGLWSLTPNGSGGGLLRAIGAQTATLLAEAVVIRYPNLQQTYGGDPIAAGGWGWGTEFPNSTTGSVPVGTKTSSGINFDFSVVYDGSVVPGWQMTPGVYYFQALSGRTPNASGLFMKGAKSANFYLNFSQNPATWQLGFNYAIFRGGSNPLDQPLGDRDYVGMYLSRNF